MNVLVHGPASEWRRGAAPSDAKGQINFSKCGKHIRENAIDLSKGTLTLFAARKIFPQFRSQCDPM
jgi:hypothetical protein